MERFFTKHRILIYILIALLFFNLATVAGIFFSLKKSENDLKDGKFPRGIRKGEFMKEKLGLSNDQEKSFDKFHEKFFQKGKILRDSMQICRSRLVELISKNETDTVAIMHVNQQIGNLHIELKKNLIEFYFQVKNICTPAQQDTLKQFIARMMEFEGGRPIHHRGHGFGHKNEGH